LLGGRRKMSLERKRVRKKTHTDEQLGYDPETEAGREKLAILLEERLLKDGLELGISNANIENEDAFIRVINPRILDSLYDVVTSKTVFTKIKQSLSNLLSEIAAVFSVTESGKNAILLRLRSKIAAFLKPIFDHKTKINFSIFDLLLTMMKEIIADQEKSERVDNLTSSMYFKPEKSPIKKDDIAAGIPAEIEFCWSYDNNHVFLDICGTEVTKKSFDQLADLLNKRHRERTLHICITNNNFQTSGQTLKDFETFKKGLEENHAFTSIELSIDTKNDVDFYGFFFALMSDMTRLQYVSFFETEVKNTLDEKMVTQRFAIIMQADQTLPYHTQPFKPTEQQIKNIVRLFKYNLHLLLAKSNRLDPSKVSQYFAELVKRNQLIAELEKGEITDKDYSKQILSLKTLLPDDLLKSLEIHHSKQVLELVMSKKPNSKGIERMRSAFKEGSEARNDLEAMLTPTLSSSTNISAANTSLASPVSGSSPTYAGTSNQSESSNSSSPSPTLSTSTLTFFAQPPPDNTSQVINGVSMKL
jgi:hypothetical protein